MHIFVFLCMFFLFGCFCGIKFATVTICCHIVAFFFVFAIKLVIFKAKTNSNLKAVFLVVFFCAGTVLGVFHDYNTFKNIKHLYGTTIKVEGTVTEEGDKTFLLDTEHGLFRCYYYNDDVAVRKYNVISVCGDVGQFSVAKYNGDSDSRLYNALRGIVGTISCDKIELTGYEKSFSIWDIGVYARDFLEVKISKFPVNSDVKGFITALLTGNTDNLDSKVKESFRLTGISHLVAVSGLHVGIFISFFWFFSFKIRKNKILHILFIFTLVAMYVLVIGERASVLRAGIMAVCGYMMFSLRRRSDSLMNLMIAGILICLANPYYVVDAGFQMSFLVTMGIIIFSPYFKSSVVAIPIIAMLFLLPVTTYYYNTISLETIIVNVIVVPLTAPIILFGYIGCFVPYFSSVSAVMANFVISVAEFFSSADWLHISVPSPDMWEFQIWFLIVCTVYNVLNRQEFRTIVMLVAIVILLVSISPAREEVYKDAHTVRFINNNKYNVIHITTENKMEILIDCGRDIDKYAVKNGIDTIDAVLISASDKDRYEGLEKLCAEVEVTAVLLPKSLKKKNLRLENSRLLYYNEDDYDFTLDGVRFKFRNVDKQRCLLMELYKRTIAVTFGEEISALKGFDVICVPDKCTDCDVASEILSAKYYIHANHRYKYYDFGNKYITSQTGMAEMIFYSDYRMFLKERR